MEITSEDLSYPPLSQRVGVRTPSFVSSEHESPQPVYKACEPTKADIVLHTTLKVLFFPLKPLRKVNWSRQKYGLKEPSKPPPVDPEVAWRAKVETLEAEIERLNEKYNKLNRDYSKLYDRAENWNERCKKAESKFETLRDAHEDLSRVVYEKYGRDEFRALRDKIEADKLEVAKKRYIASTTMLVINTNDADANDLQ